MSFLSRLLGKKAVSNDLDSVKIGLSDCIQRLVNTLNEINTAELNKDMYKRLYAGVKESRSKFTVKLQESLEKINIPESNDYDSLKKLHSSLVSVLDIIQKGNLKYAYYLDYVFGNKMNLLSSNFEFFIESVNKIEENLKEIERKRSPGERRKNLESEIVLVEREISNIKKELEKLSAEKKDKQNELIVLKEELQKCDSESYESLSSLNEKRKKIVAEIYSLVNPVNRAFKKYEKQGVFDKQTEIILKLYIEDPLKAVCIDNGEKLKPIVDSVIKLIDLNQLDLKGSMKIKVIELKDNISKIPVFAGKLKEIDNEIGSLEKVKKTEEIKFNKLKASVKSAEESIVLLNKETEFNEKRILEKTQSIEKMKEELKSLNVQD